MILISIVGIVLVVLLAVLFRVVVPTNYVHIVQSSKKTVAYGKDQAAGNAYYKWPSWVPRIGVEVTEFPVSVFDVTLDGYAAYDKGRVPFVLDLMAFFRVDEPTMAAQRVDDFDELTEQLEGILQGASRSILAKAEIEEILEERSQFGEQFTLAVQDHLKAWGVANVKNIELMDIRDAQGSKVIENIMAKKKSLIEKQSRIEVANNQRLAQEAEIDAARSVKVREQEAVQQVGIRTAEQEREVGIAKQHSLQQVNEEAKVTREKEMAVQRVQVVRQAEIQKEAEIVAAEQQRQQTIIIAEGNLEQAKRHAQGVEAEGKAEGEAKKAVLLAPVQAEITLAEKIAELMEYQRYLLGTKDIAMREVVGTAQAKALEAAHIKVISNAGTPVEGVTNVMELFTSKGGTQLGAMLEAFMQTEEGRNLIQKITGRKTIPST